MIATPSVPPVQHTQLRNTKKRRTRIFGSTKNEMPGGGLVLKPRIHANRGIKKGDIVLYQLSRISPLCCLHRRIRAPHSKGSRDTIMASQTSLKITNRSGKDVKVYLTLGGHSRLCAERVNHSVCDESRTGGSFSLRMRQLHVQRQSSSARLSGVSARARLRALLNGTDLQHRARRQSLGRHGRSHL